VSRPISISKPVIAITMGDPGGIGPEVILKSLHGGTPSSVYYLVIASRDVFEYAGDRSQIPFQAHLVPTLEPTLLREGEINFLDITREAEALYERAFGTKRPRDEICTAGKVSQWNAALGLTALKVGAYQAACGLVQGLVTAPLHKEAIRLVDPKFSGHTEYLAKVARVKQFAMMFVSPRLRVTLATIHLALQKVSRALNKESIVEKISLTHEFLKTRLKIQAPRIGVCALNPHGSEFGTEETEIIRPAVEEARQLGANVEGPLSGDQIFYDAYHGTWDAVVAMYHDQGLAPFKMIAFHEGVNVTLGLPYLRVSPDHGAAFQIAYQNKANPSAFQSALKFASRLLAGDGSS